jgi:hypothetical protein
MPFLDAHAEAQDRRAAAAIAVEGDRVLVVGGDDDQRVGVIGHLVGHGDGFGESLRHP